MTADRTMPERLGKYELHGILGKGATGVVYDAWDPEIERRVAVKTIRLPDSGDNNAEEEYGRFKREAKAAGRLNHPGIVGIYGYGEAEGIAYIAMELVEGRSLKALMDAEHRLAPSDAVRLMKELLDALAYSHACGVVHRDIKPSNILLTPQGRLKITDFGIARIESSSTTQVGLVMGTPAYMSPEQFMGQSVDQRTDIYACGVLLFQLLTGERPFEGGLTAIMHKVLHTVPPKPSELSVTAPEAFDAVVAKAMAVRPEDRYPSAQAFKVALTEALAGGPALRIGGAEADFDSDETLVVAPPRPPPPPARAPVPRPPPIAQKKPRNTLVPILAGAAAILVVLGAGAYWLLRPGAQPPDPQLATAVAPPPTPSPPAPSSPSPVIPPAEPPAAPQPTPPPETAFVAPGTTAPPAPSVTDVPAPVAPAPVIPAPAPPIPPPPVTAGEPAPPSPPPADTRAQTYQAALANVACTLLDVAVGADGRIAVAGLVGTGSPETAARAALASAGVRPQTMNWAAMRFDGPYCGVVDALRRARSPNGPVFDLSLRGGRNRLRNGETMAPVITAPALPAYLQLSYFQSNRVVVHLFPSAGGQEDALTPGKPVRVGDPRTGGWPVGDPFGADMLVAIMSSTPLPTRPAEEPSDAFLAALERAAQQITRDGGTISVRGTPIQTSK